MAEVNSKSFPPVKTWILAAVFLATLFWNSIFPDLLSSTFLICLEFAAGCCFVIFLWRALRYRSRPDLQRLMILAVVFVSTIPASALGGEIRMQMFLHSFPEFQRMTNQLDAETPDFQHMSSKFVPTGSDSRFALAKVPNGRSWLVDETVSVWRHDDGRLMVIYTAGGSMFMSEGYLYCSNDQPEKFFPEQSMEFKKIVPKWYAWVGED